MVVPASGFGDFLGLENTGSEACFQSVCTEIWHLPVSSCHLEVCLSQVFLIPVRTRAGVQGDAGKGDWFDVWELSSPVPALQRLFCRRMQGRSRGLASAVSLVLFRSAAQQRQGTGIQGQ